MFEDAPGPLPHQRSAHFAHQHHQMRMIIPMAAGTGSHRQPFPFCDGVVGQRVISDAYRK